MKQVLDCIILRELHDGESERFGNELSRVCEPEVEFSVVHELGFVRIMIIKGCDVVVGCLYGEEFEDLH